MTVFFQIKENVTININSVSLVKYSLEKCLCWSGIFRLLSHAYLNHTVVRGDLGAGNPLVDEICRDLRLELADICRPKQELPVQIGDVDGVHVDHVDVLEAHIAQVLQQLTAQPA